MLKHISEYKNVIILTGAGISASAGIPLYRDSNGKISKQYEYASDSRNLPDSLGAFWKTYGSMRAL